jgi:hypothetical protein
MTLTSASTIVISLCGIGALDRGPVVHGLRSTQAPVRLVWRIGACVRVHSERFLIVATTGDLLEKNQFGQPLKNTAKNAVKSPLSTCPSGPPIPEPQGIPSSPSVSAISASSAIGFPGSAKKAVKKTVKSPLSTLPSGSLPGSPSVFAMSAAEQAR